VRLSRTQSVPFEFDQCIVKEDGALVFHFNADGFLQRYMSCNSLTIEPYSYFVFDFADKFDETKFMDVKLPGADRWNITVYPFRVKYGSTYEIMIDPEEYNEPWVELNRLPTGYYLDGVQWLTTYEPSSSGPDRIKTWFTIAKSATAPTTVATTARAPTPAIVVPVCPMACSGKGRCQAGNTCLCDIGFEMDLVLGCKTTETTAATTVGTPAPIAVTQPVDTIATTLGTATPEPSRTVDPKLLTGTFTGTKAPTAPPKTQGGVITTTTVPTTTGGASSLVFSAVVAISAVVLAF
jgi:hypothetical protein